MSAVAQASQFFLGSPEERRWLDSGALNRGHNDVDRRALGDDAGSLSPATTSDHEEDRAGLPVSAAITGCVVARIDVDGHADQPLPLAGIPLTASQTGKRLIGWQDLDRCR